MYNLYNSALNNPPCFTPCWQSNESDTCCQFLCHDVDYQDKNLPLKINQDDMPTVEKSEHLGILRSKSNQKTENSQIEQNITKAR
jgi:hypothetical protein